MAKKNYGKTIIGLIIFGMIGLYIAGKFMDGINIQPSGLLLFAGLIVLFFVAMKVVLLSGKQTMDAENFLVLIFGAVIAILGLYLLGKFTGFDIPLSIYGIFP